MPGQVYPDQAFKLNSEGMPRPVFRASEKYVRVEGLEPPCLAALDPKSSMSTNFTTPA